MLQARFRACASLGLLRKPVIGAALLWSAARRRPLARPVHGARPVRPRGGERSADQPGRQPDRLCPPLQRHHDRPDAAARSGWSTPRTGAQTPLVAGRAAHAAALVARRHAPRLYRRRPRAAARSSTSAGWRRASRCAITGLPTAPDDVAWSPDGRQIAYRHARARRGAARSARRRPAGGRAMGASRSKVHHRGHLPRRRRGLSQARLQPRVRGLRRRRRAAPAHLRPVSTTAAR